MLFLSALDFLNAGEGNRAIKFDECVTLTKENKSAAVDHNE